jgi:hypothetical protein
LNFDFAPPLKLSSSLQRPPFKFTRAGKSHLAVGVVSLAEFDQFAQNAPNLEQNIHGFRSWQLENWKATEDISVTPRPLKKCSHVEAGKCSPTKGVAARLDFLEDTAQHAKPHHRSDSLSPKVIPFTASRLPRSNTDGCQDRDDREDRLHPSSEPFVAFHPFKHWTPTGNGSNAEGCTRPANNQQQSVHRSVSSKVKVQLRLPNDGRHGERILLALRADGHRQVLLARAAVGRSHTGGMHIRATAGHAGQRPHASDQDLAKLTRGAGGFGHALQPYVTSFDNLMSVDAACHSGFLRGRKRLLEGVPVARDSFEHGVVIGFPLEVHPGPPAAVVVLVDVPKTKVSALFHEQVMCHGRLLP